MTIDISVIIPVFNREKYISEAIESVLNQQYKPKEIIVVDDGSTDGTAQVLSQYGEKIIYIYQENKGVSTSRNQGILNSTSEFITFLDSDDIWLPEKLEAHVDSLRRQPDASAYILNMEMTRNNWHTSDFFSFRKLNFPVNGELYIHRPLCSQLKYQFAWVQNTMIRRKCIDDSNLFSNDLSLYEDFDFFCRLAMKGPWLVSIKNHVKVMRREETDNLSNQRIRHPEESLNQMLGILKKLGCLEELTKNELKATDKLIRSYRRKLAKRYIQIGDFVASKEILKENLRTNTDYKTILLLMYAASRDFRHHAKRCI